MNYQAYRKSLNQKLSGRVKQELFDFRKEILSKTSQEIYDAAHQIILKSDIAECFLETDYSPQAVKALMKSSNLLQDIYEECLEKDNPHKEDLFQIIKDFKDYMVKTEKILSEKER